VEQLGMTVGEALLQPHLSYLKSLDPILDSGLIKGLAHITGGGLTDNIPRILPEGTAVKIDQESWPVLPIFKLMQEIGNVVDAEMYRTFNMGAGMVVVCAPDAAQTLKLDLEQRGETVFEIGRVTSGNKEVLIG
jgi:phosphoribosylformylglycinamidine cyclo-ligase